MHGVICAGVILSVMGAAFFFYVLCGLTPPAGLRRPSHHHLSLAVRGEVGWRGPQVIAFFGFKVVVTMT